MPGILPHGGKDKKKRKLIPIPLKTPSALLGDEFGKGIKSTCGVHGFLSPVVVVVVLVSCLVFLFFKQGEHEAGWRGRKGKSERTGGVGGLKMLKTHCIKSLKITKKHNLKETLAGEQVLARLRNCALVLNL